MSKVAVIGIIGNSVFMPVKRFHVGGETIESSSVHFEPGGKGFNQAVAASRCGVKVSFLGAVGKEFRREFAEFLDNEGIDHTLIFKNGSTAFASIITDENGNNHVTVYQGVQLSIDDVKNFEKEIKDADVLLLNNEVLEDVNIEAIRIAKQYGVKCLLNPAPARKTCKYILDNVDIFTPNEHETLGIEEKENVIMTLGKNGCLIKANNKIIPAINCGKVIDTTGAGDTFNGVLSAMLSKQMWIESAVKIANAVASLGVTRKYAVSSIPTSKEIEKIIFDK